MPSKMILNSVLSFASQTLGKEDGLAKCLKTEEPPGARVMREKVLRGRGTRCELSQPFVTFGLSKESFLLSGHILCEEFLWLQTFKWDFPSSYEFGSLSAVSKVLFSPDEDTSLTPRTPYKICRCVSSQ